MDRRQVKNPGLAVFLSAIIPGLGQVYNGQWGKAVFFFLTWFSLITWPFAVTDAWETATRLNTDASLSVTRRAATGVLPSRGR